MRVSIGPGALFLCVALALSPAARGDEDAPDLNLVPPAPLHEQVLQLPGDPDRPADLVVTLYTPDGPGPFPLAVMNHGSSGGSSTWPTEPRYRFTMSAYYFLSRGYAVALPMMRGFAGSGGHQTAHGCDLASVAIENGRDIEAVIADLSHFENIDGGRVIVAGQSFGGWNTLGFGALQSPQNVKGLINFNGGLRTSACGSANGGADESLVSSANQLGANTQLPGIWFYGENDTLFSPDLWRSMHDAYVRAGGRAELVDIGSFMNDSHQMLSFPESIPIWAPRLDAFLSSIGMPARAIYPRYMPRPWPKPTGFAAVDNVTAVPFLTDAGREAYRKFLRSKPPRVFEISGSGSFVTTHGGFDPLARANGMCRKAQLVCMPYALDDQVVFVAPPAIQRPHATGFASLDNIAAVPWVNVKGRTDYAAFLTRPPPRAFVIGTGGESVASYGGSDPLQRAMTICANAHVECRPYAVDHDVIWTRPPPPPPSPPATGYASLEDVSVVPWVTPRSRALYTRFLSFPPPRAFVVAPGGQAAAMQGGYDPLGRAMVACRAHGLACRPYAVDDKVVWAAP